MEDIYITKARNSQAILILNLILDKQIRGSCTNPKKQKKCKQPRKIKK